MSRIRVTIPALEHMLDLPEGVSIVGGVDVEGVPCMVFDVEVADHDNGGMTNDGRTYALQYEEYEEYDGRTDVALVSVVPVPE